MIEDVKITPESFETLYLREEDGTIVLTENGKRIIINRVVPPEWKPVRVYDYERQLNDNKKEIVLVEQSYYKQLEKQFRALIRS